MPLNPDDLSPLEKEGLQSQLKFFGQCPVQLFSEQVHIGQDHYVSHPQKFVRIVNAYA